MQYGNTVEGLENSSSPIPKGNADDQGNGQREWDLVEGSGNVFVWNCKLC